MWILWGMSFDLSFVGLCWNLMESTIWGLSKQGKTCKACGLCVHTKCELKVKLFIRVPPRPESGSRFQRTAQKVYLPSLLSPVRPRHHPALARPVRANGMLISAWILTLIAAPSPTTPSLSSSDLLQAPQEESQHTAIVLFDFTPSSEFELGVRGKSVLLTLLLISSWLAEGMTVQILEPDDGSGWVKVKDPNEKNGLVPASYIGTGDKSLEGRSTIRGSNRRGQSP